MRSLLGYCLAKWHAINEKSCSEAEQFVLVQQAAGLERKDNSGYSSIVRLIIAVWLPLILIYIRGQRC